jgi:hypothetical protein
MLNSFNGNMFHPHDTITKIPIELGDNIVSAKVEVVDSPLKYNLLLGCTWLYGIMIVGFALFWILLFPHQGNIVTIDQISLCTPNLWTIAGSNVPFVGDSKSVYMSIGAGMFKDSLMGTFTLPLPPPSLNIAHINVISYFTSGSLKSCDPWVVPHLEEFKSYGDTMPLIAVEISSSTILSTSNDSSQQLNPYMECDQPTQHAQVVNSLSSCDFLDFEFPSDEAIIHIMASIDKPREDKND